jgi:Ca2+-binding RTX toxin-like protein
MSRTDGFITQSNDPAIDKTLDPSFDHYVDFIQKGYHELTWGREFRRYVLNIPVQFRLDNAPEQKAAALGALAQWSAVLPISFQEVTSEWDAEIYFNNDDDSGAYTFGFTVVNVPKNWNGGDFKVGGFGFQSFIHEIGHTLGLGHGGLYNAGSPTFPRDAMFTHDSWQYSVMSYFTARNAGHARYTYNLTSPMSADIEAMIRKHFRNADGSFQEVDVNSGNYVYGFNGKQGFSLTASGDLKNVGFTIHDTGGWDTLDFSGSTGGTTLSLIPSTFSSVNQNDFNISIFYGHNTDATDYFIEVGIGSRYADTIIGNNGNNELYGNAGNDTIYGWGGDDTIVSSTYLGSSSSGVSTIDSGDGNDRIVANGMDAILAGDGDDYVLANNDYGAHVYVDAGDGDDIVNGTQRAEGDTILGNAGNDSIFGWGGNDHLYGNYGDDVIYGGTGADYFDGNQGNDIFQFTTDIQANIIEAIADFTAGQDLFALSSAYMGKTYIQDTTNGVFVSVATEGGYWGAMVYGTHDVAAVQGSFLYL